VGNAQEEAQYTILPIDTLIQTLEDTISKKEEKRANQIIKLQNAGPFFDHSDRPGRKAAFYSFGVPGLGQIYNRKYWKLPIVYGAIGTSLYFTISNGKEMNRYNEALFLRLRDQPDEFLGVLSEAQLISRRNFYRKNFELMTVLTALFHGLNIVDAVVDAHLFEFDISDDLSFAWQPNLLTGNNRVIPGIHLSLTFK
jgi:hypothetical protein